MRENADQNNSKYGHFLRSVNLIINSRYQQKEKIEINQVHKRIDPMRLRMCTQELIINDRWNAYKLVRNLSK